MNILAIDVGTSSVKAAVLDQKSGDPVGPVRKVDYEIHRPVAGAAEIDPKELWDAIAEVVRAAVRDAPPVEGVGLTCLTPALVLLDDAGEVIAPIRIHQDRRAVPVSHKIQTECAEEFLHTVGNPPLPGGLSGLMFAQLIGERPELRPKIRHYLHGNSWVGLTLTGVAAFDPGNASFTGLYNTVTDQQWSPRWCDFLGVDRGWLPEVRDGRTTLGPLKGEVAKTLDLPEGVPVKLGLPDTSASAISVGLKPGEMLHSVGTTQVLMVVTPTPAPGRDRLTRRQGVGPEFVAVVHNPVGGVALDWLHALCYAELDDDTFYDQVVPRCVDRPTSVRLESPYLGGDRHQIDLRSATWAGLGLDTTRDDLLASVLDAMRKGHADACRTLGVAVADLSRVVLTGGGASSVVKLLPDYQGRKLELLDEGAVRGCARLFD